MGRRKDTAGYKKLFFGDTSRPLIILFSDSELILSDVSDAFRSDFFRQPQIHLLFWHTARTRNPPTLLAYCQNKHVVQSEISCRAWLSVSLCNMYSPVVERNVFEQRIALAELTAREQSGKLHTDVKRN